MDGLEQFKGWYSSFYVLADDGTPRSVFTSSALKPFQFNITVAMPLNSATTTESIVDVGYDRVAFALTCNATVFDVTYSLLDRQIAPRFFQAVPSSP